MGQVVLYGNRSLAILGGVVLLGSASIGCAEIQHQSPSMAEEGAASAHSTAQLYRQQAETASANADRYERRARSLDQHTDPKGFIRDSLMTAAETNRTKAENLEELAVSLEKEPNVAKQQVLPSKE